MKRIPVFEILLLFMSLYFAVASDEIAAWSCLILARLHSIDEKKP